MSEYPRPWPTEIRLNPAKNELHVSFTDGFDCALSAEFLRVHSPSAEVQGHSASERKLVPGKRNVTIKKVEAVGNYAVRLTFSDGHETGIYSWDYLSECGKDYDKRQSAYIAELDAAGLSRDS